MMSGTRISRRCGIQHDVDAGSAGYLEYMLLDSMSRIRLDRNVKITLTCARKIKPIEGVRGSLTAIQGIPLDAYATTTPTGKHYAIIAVDVGESPRAVDKAKRLAVDSSASSNHAAVLICVAQNVEGTVSIGGVNVRVVQVPWSASGNCQ